MTNCIICQNTIKERDILTSQMVTEDGHLDGDCFCGDCGIDFLVWVLERQSSEKETIQRFKDFKFSNRF